MQVEALVVFGLSGHGYHRADAALLDGEIKVLSGELGRVVGRAERAGQTSHPESAISVLDDDAPLLGLDGSAESIRLQSH